LRSTLAGSFRGGASKARRQNSVAPHDAKLALFGEVACRASMVRLNRSFSGWGWRIWHRKSAVLARYRGVIPYVWWPRDRAAV